ncbi:hypothetical protein DFH08DRAFT_1079810 [Mycena albidolilacea]|uniref:Transmembrane protein n=1 Tax=Mycena albidolilacea TaxID=1033008 RepID=A0AAD7ERP5_9AGAR|nr:hypothetical protein DFH08DRAFT_1079810 [Mycena albidolilacea]
MEYKMDAQMRGTAFTQSTRIRTMVQIVRYLTLFSLATVGLSMVVKRDVIAVGADITAMAKLTTDLDNSIKACNSLAQALATPPLSGPDCTTISDSLLTLKVGILASLTNIVVKKLVFEALPVGGVPALILINLQNLRVVTVAYARALIAISSGSCAATQQQILIELEAGFATAIKAYSP